MNNINVRIIFVMLVMLLVHLHHAAPSHAQATFVIVNDDAPGVGLNDTTPASPVGGNAGTTLGEQRLNVLQAAADAWGEVLHSSETIGVNVQFLGLACTANQAVLGVAGARNYALNFTNAPFMDTLYPIALANALAGQDLDPDNPDILVQLNVNLGSPGCFTEKGWYLGLDGAPGPLTDLYSTVLHELAHGLGMGITIDLETGEKFAGLNDAYMLHLEDHSLGQNWPALTDAQRAASATDGPDLHWAGNTVRSLSGHLTAGTDGDHVRMLAPSPLSLGSSVTHFDSSLEPDDLMEAFHVNARMPSVPSVALLADIGWSLADADTDLIADPLDNCPSHANSDQADNDNDSIGDICDPDDDNDEMSDSYEISNGLDPLTDDADLDQDEDGLSNLQESSLGTIANNPDTDNDGLPDGYEVDNGLSATNPDDAAEDADIDGLSNLEEYNLGTGIDNPDSDQDGISDGDEVNYGLNPLDDADAALDPDNDGLSNLAEIDKQTDLDNPDSDQDGIIDGQDLDPLDASDGPGQLAAAIISAVLNR